MADDAFSRVHTRSNGPSSVWYGVEGVRYPSAIRWLCMHSMRSLTHAQTLHASGSMPMGSQPMMQLLEQAT
eukprot:358611-Chlamydomonas_euryale.AAC.1